MCVCVWQTYNEESFISVRFYEACPYIDMETEGPASSFLTFLQGNDKFRVPATFPENTPEPTHETRFVEVAGSNRGCSR
jgi:hypothetical protein